jgi:hypothetical protein
MACPASQNLRRPADDEIFITTAGFYFQLDMHYDDNPSLTGLPSGLTKTHCNVAGNNNDYARISGTPDDISTPHSYFAVYKGSNRQFTIMLRQAPRPVITSTPPVAVKGQAYSYQITATPTTAQVYNVTEQLVPLTMTYTVTGLPEGLVATPSGLIHGVPTQAYPAPGKPILIHATCEGNPTGTDTLQHIEVQQPPPTVTNVSPGPTWEETVAITPYFITATEDPTSFNATNLPDGLSVNTTTGEITGTPTLGTSPDDENFFLLLSATNGYGTGSKVVQVKVISHLPPKIYSPLEVQGYINEPFTYNILAYHAPSPGTTYGATGLPAGLSINTSTGVISGTPTAFAPAIDSYIYSVSISATTLYGTDTETLDIFIGFRAPTINSADYVIGETGSPLSYQITIDPSGEDIPPAPPATPFSVEDPSGLPPGMSIDGETGLISGTPTTVGQYPVNVLVDNTGLYGGVPADPPAQKRVTFYVFSGPPNPTGITPRAEYPVAGFSKTAVITGTNFFGGPNAAVMFGNSEHPLTRVSGANVTFSSSTSISVKLPELKPSTIPYDVIVLNDDRQAGILPAAFTVPFPGTATLDVPRYTSLDTDETPIYDVVATGGTSRRAVELGTNVEVLFYSGRDVPNKKLLNVYRRQLGTNSTRHGGLTGMVLGDLVFKGILSLQAGPLMYESASTDAIDGVYCLLRSNGRIDMRVATLEGAGQADNTSKAYASYQATLIKSVDPITPLETENP